MIHVYEQMLRAKQSKITAELGPTLLLLLLAVEVITSAA
jgi:hypothetical protein